MSGLKECAGMFRWDHTLGTALLLENVAISWTVLSSKGDLSQPVIKVTTARIGQ